jgi:hypothetical protein
MARAIETAAVDALARATETAADNYNVKARIVKRLTDKIE